MNTYSLRLTPGQDLKQELDGLVAEMKWSAACILTGIGSLRSAAIRFANAEMAEMLEGPFEIISLGGTLSRDGSHIHILVCDGEGVPKGGHLKEGAIVNTTAEIVLGILPGWDFTRRGDPETGCAELGVTRLEADENGPDDARCGHPR
jgi:predicted DNA-binding protein with PD1-like motif